mgnify:CR=1 FL=1
MGGGLLELQYIGNEEAYFLYNPEITFFKSVYRRFTNFAMETISNEFENSSIAQPFSEKKIHCKIAPRRGDLIKHMSLVIDLPALQCTEKYAVQWAPNVGCILLQAIEFMIESQSIDKITGEWLYIYHELYSSNEERESFHTMINHPRTPISDELLQAGNYVIPARKMIIPVPFWFSRSSGNNFPLVALGKNHVQIHVTFSALEKAFIVRDKDGSEWKSPKSIPNILLSDFAVDSSPFTTIGTLDLNAELSVMYVFLEENEKNQISEQNLVYTLTNVQYVTAKELKRNTYKTPLQVKHPMREIVWVLQRDDVLLRNDWFNYTNYTNKDQTEIENIMQNNPPIIITSDNSKHILNSASLLLNKAPRFDSKPTSYFSELQPHIFMGKKVQDGIYLYNFGLNPKNVEQPSGTCNASALNSIELVTDIVTSPNNTYYNLRVFVVAYNQLRIMGGFGGLQFSS